MIGHYILDGREPRPATLEEWAEWSQEHQRSEGDDGVWRVGITHLRDCYISTVFLGIDHAWHGGPPLLFESMVFGGQHDQYQRRYSTYAEAEAGHMEIATRIKAGLSPEDDD